MFLTKDQIESFINKVGQPKASVILNGFLNAYRAHLCSKDVLPLYDEEYLAKIESHERAILVAGQYKINVYNKFSYEYLVSRLKKGSEIIDMGCGSGDFALAIASHGPCRVVGIDFSKRVIEQADAKLEKSGLQNCSFLCGSIANVDLKGQYHYVVLNDVVEHLNDGELSDLFEKARLLLRPHGEIVIHTPNGLALCNDTDTNLIQRGFKLYLRTFKKWRGHERGISQLYYDQVHINIKSFRQLKKLLKQFGYCSRAYYDEGYRLPFLRQLSSNMLVIAERGR